MAMKILAGTTSLMSAIKPLHYVSSIFGLTTFLPVQGKLHRRKHGKIPYSLIWTCIWIILYAASSYLQLSGYIFSSTPETPIKITTLDIVYTISLNLTCLISLCLCSVFRTHQISEIIDKLELLTSTFMTKLDETTTYRRTKIIILLEIIFVLGVNGYVDTMYVYNSCDLTIWNCVSPVMESLGCVCNSLIIVQFVTLVLILRDKCKYINDILMKSSEDALKHPVTMFQTREALEVLCIETRTLPTIPHRNQLTRNQVLDCRLILTKLKSVSRLICSYYGFPILLATFWLFINIITVLHSFVFYESESYNNDDFLKYTIMFDCIMWCIYCAMLMTLMTLACHLASEEPNITMFHVQNLLLSQTLRKETIEELSKFSSQLSKMKIEITACGFFVLNLQFLYGFFGVTVAYFVIMCQLN
jgi:hypothetical protein